MAIRFCEIGWLNVSVDLCVFCSSVYSVRKRTFAKLAGEIFLSQSAQSSLSIFAHCFEPMRRWPLPQPLPRREGSEMWGYPYKTAIKGRNEAYILFIGVSRWLLPFPSGEGKGEGPLSFCPLCVLFFCVFLWEKICHSLFVIMSFCLTKNISLLPSLCYSVFKTTPSVSPVLMLLCLQNYPVYLCL